MSIGKGHIRHQKATNQPFAFKAEAEDLTGKTYPHPLTQHADDKAIRVFLAPFLLIIACFSVYYPIFSQSNQMIEAILDFTSCDCCFIEFFCLSIKKTYRNEKNVNFQFIINRFERAVM